jgi:hypothetical protein
MNKRKKRPLSITLAAASVLAVITFIIGILIPSVFMIDSRIKSANDEISSLKETVSQQKKEISSLNEAVKQKDDANVALGDAINEHLSTIDELRTQISQLEGEVNFAAEAAVSGISSASDKNRLLNSASRLSSQQMLIILAALFVLVIFIVSVTCGVIASLKKISSEHAPSKKDDEAKALPEKIEEAQESEDSVTDEESVDYTPFDEEAPNDEKPEEAEEAEPVEEEKPEKSAHSFDITNAIDALYKNNLETSYQDLGGFLFGITNYDDILNDKAKGKSFGNSENGDFVAFMDSSSDAKKLYIIPRSMSLSDSTVTLRGMCDLFNISDSQGNHIKNGSVKIDTVDSPAVFAFGSNGWAIESKGEIKALEPYKN